ncbi:hypothetical protein MCOR21_007021 [Pyricularia oryzae]|nr:hypothetical protein MCOR21_007021 [Pyricularia oryzae]
MAQEAPKITDIGVPLEQVSDVREVGPEAEAITQVRMVRANSEASSLSDMEKKSSSTVEVKHQESTRSSTDVEDNGREKVSANMEVVALKALHTDDDPTQNPWTFRAFFLGLALAAFGSSLATIFHFRPQSIGISITFLTVISYVFGNAMARYIPSKGPIGRFLNPHGFNSKEHLGIIIMASSASSTAHATDVLAAQKLFYNIVPHPAVAIMLLFSSQLLGYGLAGYLRESLVYPTAMIWPSQLPLASLIETLHRNRTEMASRWKFFWIIFWSIAVYEFFPQYITPVLTGVSVFCLAQQKNHMFTNIFGGAAGNEGLGVGALSFDLQYIGVSAFFLPLKMITNAFIGYVLCIVLFVILFYRNVWSAMQFPFLSQQLFAAESNSTHYRIYNQSAILNDRLELDEEALKQHGLPFFAATHASALLTTNLATGATILHIILYHPQIVKSAMGWGTHSWRRYLKYLKNPKQIFKYEEKTFSPTEDPANLDPHHRTMLQNYKEVPNWWYGICLGLSVIAAGACIYLAESTLPWYLFFLAIVIAYLYVVFFGALSGLLGFHVPIGSAIQLLGGWLNPGKPLSLMFFSLFAFTTSGQALYLVSHLKLGQYGKLAPRCTFTFQILGTVVGCILNFALMSSITTEQRDILLSIQGTNIWSGTHVQSFNSNAISFGALSKFMFVGGTYASVVYALPLGFLIPLPLWLAGKAWPKYAKSLSYIVTPVICAHLGFLSGGINSSVFMHFILAFTVQFYVRKKYPAWFLKYNYLLAAALSGGLELTIFFLTFIFNGAVMKQIPMPNYALNPKGNLDYCMRDPALAGARGGQ